MRRTDLLLLHGLVDEEGSAECSLLRDLLRLDGARELGRERDVGDRHVVEHEVEPVRARGERVPYQPRDLPPPSAPSRVKGEGSKEGSTFSRWVMSCDALNCATTLFSTSFTIDGSTRSS